jgi:hypothetical protein
VVARSSIVVAFIGCKQPRVDSDLYQGKTFSITVKIKKDNNTKLGLRSNILPCPRKQNLAYYKF